MRRYHALPTVALALAALAGSAAVAQTPTTPTGAQPVAGAYERNTGRTNPALSFYGRPNAATYQQAQAQPAQLPPPAPIQMARVGKPFSGLRQTGGVSPYLALDARESADTLPNYYLFVKPQLDQQAFNQVQQAQFQRLQRQVRTASSGSSIVAGPGGVPTTGHSTQFMNNGGYYPQLQR